MYQSPVWNARSVQVVLESSDQRLMAEGFPFRGKLDKTGVFKTRPPEEVVLGTDVSWLYRHATSSQDNVSKQVESKASDDGHVMIYVQTVPRFGVRQGTDKEGNPQGACH